MKLDKYNKLKLRFEVFKLEQNYLTLDRILYYFSFLGNIFLIYFGYFFVKTITNTIPSLFPFQDIFFTIFVALFLTGYELTKRFVLQQLATSIVQVKKITTSIALGTLVCVALVSGSFYLSIKGAHRLVDTSAIVVAKTDSTVTYRQDSITKYYDKEILYYRNQANSSRQDRKYRDSIVADLQQKKDLKIQEIEKKTAIRSASESSTIEENSTAFLFITLFLELIVLIGVGFDAFYTLGSYEETKKLLQTPKFRQLELNLKLLKLYYQNGKKDVGDPTLSFNKFRSLVQTQGINCSQKDLKAFITGCQELDIIRDYRNKKKEFAISYQQAKELIENQELI